MKKGILRNANLQIGKGWGYEPIVLIGDDETHPKGAIPDANFVSEMIKQEVSSAQETTGTALDDMEKTIAAALNDLDNRIKNINV